MVEQLSAGFKIRKQLQCNLISCMQYLLLLSFVCVCVHSRMCVCGYVGVCVCVYVCIHMRVHVLLLWGFSSSTVVLLRIQLFWDIYKLYCNLLFVCCLNVCITAEVPTCMLCAPSIPSNLGLYQILFDACGHIYITKD